MAEIPIVLTKQQQATTLANYLPGGRLFAAKSIIGTKIRSLLLGLACELIRTDSLISLFRIDTNPSVTNNFIEEWESVLGIPDSCFTGTGSVDDRRLAILIKLSALGVQTDPDFVDLAAKFGINVEVESGSVHGAFPFILPIKFYPSAKAARFTMVVRPLQPLGELFTYTFPFPFGTSELVIIECLFNTVKPANVEVVFENPF